MDIMSERMGTNRNLMRKIKSTNLHILVREFDIEEHEEMMIGMTKELDELVKTTQMLCLQDNGQRRFGPRNDYKGPPPPRGCEVFVGKIPRDCFEPELYPVFEKAGKVYEIRMMMDFSGSNRGYCFVQYYTPQEAQNAIRKLNNYQIRKGRWIGVVKSVDNCRLFVGGIPKDKTEKEIFEEMKKVTDGAVRAICYPSVHDKNKNRGFAFVQYETHKLAAMARRKMIPGKIPLFGNAAVAVDWAEPEPDIEAHIMEKVKVLYVRNLMLNTTEETLEDLFNQASDNAVERVKKQNDYAFVHFTTRESAERAKETLGKELDIDGSIAEIHWSKPPTGNRIHSSSSSSPSPTSNHSSPQKGSRWTGEKGSKFRQHQSISPFSYSGYFSPPCLYPFTTTTNGYESNSYGYGGETMVYPQQQQPIYIPQGCNMNNEMMSPPPYARLPYNNPPCYFQYN